MMEYIDLRRMKVIFRKIVVFTNEKNYVGGFEVEVVGGNEIRAVSFKPQCYNGSYLVKFSFEYARVQALGFKLLPPSEKINNSLKS